MKSIFKKTSLLFLLMFSFALPLFCGSASYEITELSNTNPVFSKFKGEIQNNYKIWKNLRKNFNITELQKLKRISIAIYRVKKGDTVFTIAEKLGIVVDTLISFNSISSNLALEEGDDLLIPNMDGIVLFPKQRIFLAQIENIYKIPPSVLMYINNIQRDFVYPREEVFIPFARMNEEEKSYFLAKPFIYPLKGGRFTSPFGVRKDPFTHKKTFHGGIDIGVPIGTPVYAAAAGKVIFVGNGKGYGKLVVIKHNYEYSTWYGHLSGFKVKKGDYVKQGDLIALSGNTGRTTGPHLHFEVRRFNLRTNPLEALDFSHVPFSF